MRVLLTGATGFIGAQAARSLIAQGAEVHALVREGADLSRIADLAPRMTLIRGDLRELGSPRVRDPIARARPELCVHLAWYAVPGKYLTAPENLSLVGASLELAALVQALGCRRFVGAGTCFEYAMQPSRLSEDAPLSPTTLYAASKRAVCAVLERFLAGQSFAWLRFFYQYGPHEPAARLVPSVISALLRGEIAQVTTGEQVRDFLHVADVGDAIARVALSDLRGPVNIGSGQPVTVRTLVAAIAEILGASDRVAYGAIPHRPGDPPYVCADNAKLRSIGWAPQHDLRGGLAATVAWYRS
jgi:nucleoside-diphosphate-sugar epimerase